MMLHSARSQYYYDDWSVDNQTSNNQTNSYVNIKDDDIVSYVLQNYTKTLRPAVKVSISMRISLRQLASIDQVNQVMTTNLYLSSTWQDPRLAWDASSFANLSEVILPASSIWLPDLMVINSADGSGFVPINTQSLMSVNSLGLVNFVVSLINLKTKCKLNFFYYPYDKVNF